jgi:hypothetical protein
MNLRYFRESLARRGIVRVILRYGYRAARRVVGLDISRVFYLPHEVGSVDVLVPGKYSWGKIPEGQLLREAADPRSGLETNEVRACIARGEVCFGVWNGQQLLSYIWVAPSGAHVCQGVGIRFETQYAFSRWAFTIESHRGLNLHAQLKHHALRVLALEGKRGLLSTIDIGNLESLAAAERAGCQRAGWILVASLFGHQVRWVSAGCRRFAIGLALAGDKVA